MRESAYQADLVKRIKDLLPDCVILKNDSSYMQGVPDLLVLWEDRWAMLEVKASEKAPLQPNQLYWVRAFNEMSFSAVIFPENEELVLDALQQSFRARRPPFVSKRK